MNEPLPKVAVLLTTYNGEKFIEEQCASIFSQLNVDVTIYFSDDCSTDSTMHLLKRICNENINCYILSENNKFGSACENFLSLILKAPINNFDYISFADQDDIWLPNKLACAVDKLVKNNALGFSSDVISWNPEESIFKRVEKHGNQTVFDYMFQGPGPGCTFVIKSSIALELSKFIKTLSDDKRKSIWFHDWFIYAYFRSKEYKWFIDSYSGMLYRQHSSNVIGSNIGLRGIIDRLKVLKKWRKQTIILSQILGYYNNLPIYRIRKLGFYIIKSPFNVRRKIKDSFLLFLASLFRIF